MKLNLGSGTGPSANEFFARGYINVDRALDAWHCVEVYPLDFPDNSCEEVRASHILEHLSFRVTMDALKDWVRVLKPGGILKIAVPDFEWIARQYIHEVDNPGSEGANITGYLMGAQTDENDYHKAIFDARGLKHGMEACGLVDVRLWESDADDCSSLPVSLNMQGMKPASDGRGSIWGTERIGHADGTVTERSVEVTEAARAGKFAIDAMSEICDGDAVSKARQASEAPENVTSEAAETLPDEAFEWLRPRAYNKYSQWGEDGLLEAIFEKIGTTNKTVIECGAGHPVQGSNSRKLIEEGWKALLVEPDQEKRAALFGEYGDRHKNVKIVPYNAAARTTMQSGLFLTSLDDILTQNFIDEAPDLLVIDVDGQDWYLWNGMLHHRPRVVIIEFGHDSEPDFIPAEHGEGQAGKHAIEQLAINKGYEPVVLTGHNFICVDRACIHLLNDGDTYVTEPVAEPGKILFDTASIGAIMSAPRLGFLDNMFSCYEIAMLGIHLERGGGAFWDQGLTRMMENALAADRKYILTLDYDSVFKKEDVIELYRIMASPGGENIDALAAMQIRREKDGVLLTMQGTDGKNRSQVDRAELAQIAMPVRTAHFGLTLIRADAIRKMSKPWFSAVPDANGEWGEGRLDPDINFWVQFQECGNTLYSANHVVAGHCEMVISWPNNELKTLRQAQTEYHESGKPAGCWK